MTSNAEDNPARATDSDPPVPERAECCIVGGGPAGLLLALLLGRRGISVVVLEAHRDFAREFRGNTLNPATLAILGDLGLAGPLLRRPHTKVRQFAAQTDAGEEPFADFTRLRGRYRFVAMLPQAEVLAVVAAAADRLPSVRIVMGARAEGLIEEGGAIRGVRYRSGGAACEIRAPLVIGADGRASRVRRLAGLEPTRTTPTMDVLWFRLPRLPSDPPDAATRFRFGRGCLIALMEERDHWQVGYILRAGSYGRLRAAGLPALRGAVAETAPEFADRLAALRAWDDCALLSVESARLRRWHRPGLLLIGDAAHPTSPVGGVGINLAIQDAVVAARVLARSRRAGRVSSRALARVQRRRAPAVRLVQGCQELVQRTVVSAALRAPAPYRLPATLRLFLRLPGVRAGITRLIATGLGPTGVGSRGS